MFKIILLSGLLIVFQCNVNGYPFTPSSSDGNNNASAGNISNLINQLITHKTNFLSNFLRALTPGQNNGNNLAPTSTSTYPTISDLNEDGSSSFLTTLRPTELTSEPTTFNTFTTRSSTTSTTTTTASTASIATTTDFTTTTTASTTTNASLRPAGTTSGYVYPNPKTDTSASIDSNILNEVFDSSDAPERSDSSDSSATSIPLIRTRVDSSCDTLLPGHNFPLPAMWLACPE